MAVRDHKRASRPSHAIISLLHRRLRRGPASAPVGHSRDRPRFWIRLLAVALLILGIVGELARALASRRAAGVIRASSSRGSAWEPRSLVPPVVSWPLVGLYGVDRAVVLRLDKSALMRPTRAMCNGCASSTRRHRLALFSVGASRAPRRRRRERQRSSALARPDADVQVRSPRATTSKTPRAPPRAVGVNVTARAARRVRRAGDRRRGPARAVPIPATSWPRHEAGAAALRRARPPTPSTGARDVARTAPCRGTRPSRHRARVPMPIGVDDGRRRCHRRRRPAGRGGWRDARRSGRGEVVFAPARTRRRHRPPPCHRPSPATRPARPAAPRIAVATSIVLRAPSTMRHGAMDARSAQPGTRKRAAKSWPPCSTVGERCRPRSPARTGVKADERRQCSSSSSSSLGAPTQGRKLLRGRLRATAPRRNGRRRRGRSSAARVHWPQLYRGHAARVHPVEPRIQQLLAAEAHVHAPSTPTPGAHHEAARGALVNEHIGRHARHGELLQPSPPVPPLASRRTRGQVSGFGACLAGNHQRAGGGELCASTCAARASRCLGRRRRRRERRRSTSGRAPRSRQRRASGSCAAIVPILRYCNWLLLRCVTAK